ncbi:hypothetical protein Z517_11200 [Fonsecaea pedrosoi CBS 271.37]|uniref:Unplaced genomic scaffold supercont1.7, whole genome shotgun sequence n=1 Tax=Fonsecaea pedrosoi CBS 271.37 TaxID=1442368 RepID=A0A0D2GVR8_9EURO|nr:uncharacterized protein Z517_11200 [Fonsecaea pedrosoi CBS 271.37]KIW76454.1 hypothetical protein Z517_11200 [Fonsecaea pedrosoi CBS 271.37]
MQASPASIEGENVKIQAAADHVDVPPNSPDDSNVSLWRELRAIKWKKWLVIISLGFIYNMGISIYLCLSPIIGIINADIGPDPAYSWLPTCWTVATGVGLIVAGTLSDVLGRRWFVIGTGVLGVAGGICGALAQNIPTALASLTILGLNHAGAMNTLAAIAEIVPTRLRGIILGAVNAGILVWATCGSLIGHEVAVHTAPGWRTLFWIIVAANGLATLLVAINYFPAKPLAAGMKTRRQLLKEFDYVGLALATAGPTLFFVGIKYVPTYGAKSGYFLGPFLAGIALMVCLGCHQAFYASNPIMKRFLFRRVREFTLILVVAAVGGMLFYSIVAFFSTYLRVMFHGDNTRAIGVDYMPFGAGTNVGGVSSALLLPIIAPVIGTRLHLAIGVTLQVLFIPLMCLPTANSRGMALAFSFFAGAGIGWVELLTILLIQLATPDEWIGVATGLLGMMRSIGGSAGSAVYTTILNSRSADLIPEYVGSAALEAGLPAGSLRQLLGILTGVVTGESITDVPGISPSIIQVSTSALHKAWRQAFHYVWLTSIPFGVIALGCAIMTKDVSGSEVFMALMV